jgi:hypothetical protein
MDPDPDPGGPKTCGSGGSGFGSATLLKFRNFTLAATALVLLSAKECGGDSELQ